MHPGSRGLLLRHSCLHNVNRGCELDRAKREFLLGPAASSWGKPLIHAYFILAFPTAFGLLAISVYGFNKTSKTDALIHSQAQNAEEWAKRYGGSTPAEVAEQAFLVSLLISACTLLNGLCHLAAAHHAHQLGVLTDPASQLIKSELMVTVEGLLACLTLCALIDAQAALTNLPGLAPVPPFLLHASIFLVALLFLFSGATFYCLYSQKKGGITALASSSILAGSLVFVFALLLLLYVPYSRKELVRSCADMLPLLNDDYIAQAGCTDGKYHDLNATIGMLTCPKEEVKFAWEENYLAPRDSNADGQLFGCINTYCCKIVIADTRLIFSFSVWTSFMLSAAAMLASVTALMLKGQIKETGRKYFSGEDLVKGHLWIFLLLIAGIVVVLVYDHRHIYKVPVEPSFLRPKPLDLSTVAPMVGEELRDKDSLGIFHFPASRYINGFYKLDIKINENRSKCEKMCDDFVYLVSVESGSPENKLSLPDTFKVPKQVTLDSATNDTSIRFRSYFKDLNTMLRQIQFVPANPILPSSVLLEVRTMYLPEYREELEKRKDGKRRLDNDFYSGEDPSYLMLRRVITFQMFSSEHKVKYRGNTMEVTENGTNAYLGSVNITARMFDETGNVLYQGRSDDSGMFSLVLPVYVVIRNFSAIAIPYSVLIKFEKEDYLASYSSLTVNANGFTVDEETDTIVLQRNPFVSSKLMIDGTALNIVDESPVRGSVLMVGEGVGAAKTGSDGQFAFKANTECRTTTLSCTDEETYYDVTERVPCAASQLTVFFTPVITDYRIRTVLSWSGPPADLDLHLIFRKDASTECRADFTQPRCGGAVYWGDRKAEYFGSGAEMIDIATVGNHQYLFYADAFGMRGNESLSFSGARANVYSGMLGYPVASVFVPTDEILMRVRVARLIKR